MNVVEVGHVDELIRSSCGLISMKIVNMVVLKGRKPTR